MDVRVVRTIRFIPQISGVDQLAPCCVKTCFLRVRGSCDARFSRCRRRPQLDPIVGVTPVELSSEIRVENGSRMGGREKYFHLGVRRMISRAERDSCPGGEKDDTLSCTYYVGRMTAQLFLRTRALVIILYRVQNSDLGAVIEKGSRVGRPIIIGIIHLVCLLILPSMQLPPKQSDRPTDATLLQWTLYDFAGGRTKRTEQNSLLRRRLDPTDRPE